MRTRGPVLAGWARGYLRETLGGARAARPAEPWCDELAATFVTLRWRDGRLQGCIGSLAAVRAIADDVAEHVVAAALRDPRSEPIGLDDVDALDLEISLLSPMERVARAEIRPGIDGLVLVHRGRRGTLLPVVWKHLPQTDAFLGALVEKAGFPRGTWRDDFELYRYTTDCYRDVAR